MLRLAGFAQQLVGVGAALFGEAGAAQHAGDLVAPLGGGQLANTGDGAAGGDLLFDAQVMVGVGRDLRQVGDAQHLPVASHGADVSPDAIGGGATDAGIDLVKDAGGDAVG